MCGVAGIFALTDSAASPKREELLRMAGALRHRGPDEFGIYRDRARRARARAAFDHRPSDRPTAARATKTTRSWVVFNGEIFNYVELRDELRTLGHRFRTQSDTEVIVHAYEAWGDERLRPIQRTMGDRLWDAERACARSRARSPSEFALSISASTTGRLYFASEVKAIFAADADHSARLRSRRPRPDVHVLDRSCRRSRVFAGVTELRPAHVASTKRAACESTHAAPPAFPEDAAGGFRWLARRRGDAVRDALDEATRLRMLRADVPVGSYLSGGLDSSLVAALGLRAKGERFATFSLRFEDAEYDETELTSARWPSISAASITRSSSRGGDIASVFPDVVAHTERPILRTAPAPLFLLSRLVRDAGHQGRAHRRRRRRDVRRLRSLPRSQGAPLLGAPPELDAPAAAPRTSLPVPRALAGRAAGDGATVLRARISDSALEPGFAHDMRWHTTTALKRLFSRDVRRATRRDATSPRSCSPRCRRSSQAGARSRRTNISRSGPCSRDTSCRRKAIAC